jgi:hypothetical protein
MELRGMQERHLIPYLRSKGYTAFEYWAVVGNGPLYLSDRVKIARADIVVRFNDANNRWRGEKTDLHVVRHPSWYTLSRIEAPAWDVAPLDSLMPDDAKLKLYVYEAQHGDGNKLNSSSRIFEKCNCGNSCLERRTWAGPSTGAAVVSELQSMPEITRLGVYGFNGMGDEEAHIDFANKTIIKNCCTKCTLHETATDRYGNEAALTVFATLLGVFIVVAVLPVVLARRVVRQMLKAPERRPLLALAPAVENRAE